MDSRPSEFLSVSTRDRLDRDDHFVGILTKVQQGLVRSRKEAAHDQLAVHEEGRGDGHPKADALVHVQLTCGLAR